MSEKLFKCVAALCALPLLLAALALSWPGLLLIWLSRNMDIDIGFLILAALGADAIWIFVSMILPGMQL